jgi:hypothetical protein
LLKLHPIQFATPPDAQRANGSRLTRTRVNILNTQMLSPSSDMMKTSSTLSETK